jgi:hypothetical protein
MVGFNLRREIDFSGKAMASLEIGFGKFLCKQGYTRTHSINPGARALARFKVASIRAARLILQFSS